MLADGYLEKGKPTYNTRLRIDHTYPDQKSYVFSLYTLFGDLIDMEPVIVVRKADPRTGKIYKSIYVRTLRFPCLNEYHFLFYAYMINDFIFFNIICVSRIETSWTLVYGSSTISPLFKVSKGLISLFQKF